MKKLIKIIALCAVATMAAPAHATSRQHGGCGGGDTGACEDPFTFNLTGNSPMTGSNGNERLYSVNNGSDTLSLRVTAWSIKKSTGLVTNSYLGAYPGGLGATSQGGDSSHTIDNSSRIDFLLFQFDQAVQLDQAYFTAFGDTDATFGFATFGGAWNADATPLLNNQNVSALNALFPTSTTYNIAGGYSSGSRAINPGDDIGNWWIVSASRLTGQSDDSFKLKSLDVCVPPGVPEPSTWALMLAGFGAVGGAMRRRKRHDRAGRLTGTATA